MTPKRWQDWVILVLGVWLFFSPFVLDYTQSTAAVNAYVIGLAVGLLAILALLDSKLWEEWATLALGAWLIVSPFVLGYSNLSTPAWNHVIVGLLIGADALWVITRRPAMPRATR